MGFNGALGICVENCVPTARDLVNWRINEKASAEPKQKVHVYSRKCIPQCCVCITMYPWSCAAISISPLNKTILRLLLAVLLFKTVHVRFRWNPVSTPHIFISGFNPKGIIWILTELGGARIGVSTSWSLVLLLQDIAAVGLHAAGATEVCQQGDLRAVFSDKSEDLVDVSGTWYVLSH